MRYSLVKNVASNSIASFGSTSAQLTLILALYSYSCIFDILKKTDLFDEQGEIDRQKLTLFLENLRAIVNALLSDDSKQMLESNESQSKTNFPAVFHKAQHRLLLGKLVYFDSQDKIQLSPQGANEIRTFFANLETQFSLQEAHNFNEYAPQKAAPISCRRVAFNSSVLNSLAMLVSYGLIFEEDNLFSQSDDPQSILTLESISSILIGLGLSITFITNILKRDKENRTREIIEQYRRTTVKAILAMKPDKWPIEKEKVLKYINNKFNVDIFKGSISAESARTRSYYNIVASAALGTVAVVASLTLFALDCGTLSVSFWIRLGLAVVGGAIVMRVRYWAKEQQNMQKLYAKNHRAALNQTFQKQLIAELTVYGLQPIPSEDGTLPLISATTVGVKRQVEVDVENFLKKRTIYSNNNSLSIYDETNEAPHFFCKKESDEQLLRLLKEYVREHMPEEYRSHDAYFVKEFLFQIRQKYLREEKALIDAEREQCFCQPAAHFNAKKDNMSIRKMNQYISVHQAKTDIILPRESEVLTYLHRSLRWNPLIFIKTMLNPINKEIDIAQVKKKLLYTFSYRMYAAMHFSMMPWQNNEHILNAYYIQRKERTCRKLAAKKTPKNSYFHRSSSSLFKEFIESDEKVLPQKVQNVLLTKPTSEFQTENCNSVSTLENEYPEGELDVIMPIQKEANTKIEVTSNEIGKKSLKQQHKDNMAGVFLASILASGTTALYILYPILGYTASITLDVGTKTASYLGVAAVSKYCGIYFRREAKQAARCDLRDSILSFSN